MMRRNNNRIALCVLNLLILIGVVCASTKGSTPPSTKQRNQNIDKNNAEKESQDKTRNGFGFQWLPSKLLLGKNETDQLLEPVKEGVKKKPPKKKTPEKKQEFPDKSETLADKGKAKESRGLAGWLRPQKKKLSGSEKEADLSDIKAEQDKKEQDKKKAEAAKEAQKEKTDQAAPVSSTNTTKASSTETSVPPLHTNTTRYMIMRAPQTQQQQISPFLMPSPQQGTGVSPASGSPMGRQPTANVILISYAASLLSTLLRLWFLTSITKWWSEEEIVRPTQHFMWESLNDRYSRDEKALQTAMNSPPPGVSDRKWRRIVRRQGRKNPPKPLFAPSEQFERTVLVIELKDQETKSLDFRQLQQIVTFVLTQHRRHAFGTTKGTSVQRELEVVLLVESPGGAVHDFGLASAQVGRLSKEAGITTTVCVDGIAASGGYMIASQANQLCAAPFATVGSVGVLTQNINVHEALKRYGIDSTVLKAGDAKAPLTMFGSVSSSDVRQVQRKLEKTHKAFQQFVVEGRPALAENLKSVCNGDVYLGSEAEELELVDRVVTSEEYLLERIMAGDRVLKLHKSHQSRFKKRHFSPIDFLEHRSGALRAMLKNFVSSGSAGDLLSRIVQTSSIVGFVQYLLRNRNF